MKHLQAQKIKLDTKEIICNNEKLSKNRNRNLSGSNKTGFTK